MVTRRELIRRLSALSGAGMAGLLPTQAVPADGKNAPARSSTPPPKQRTAVPRSTTSAVPVWDGSSGGTGAMFNKGALLPWENKGGDWYDANGVAQGPKPLATMALDSAGPHEVDLSAFADKLADGIFLLGRGGVHIGSRYNANPAQRPILICDGKEIPCQASSPLAVASSSPQPVADPTFGDGANMMLQFDIPAGTKSARLRMTVTQSYSGKHTADVFLLRAPRLFTGGDVRQGIAAKYDHDVGINGDPGVYFSTKFDDDWIKALFPEGGIIAPAVIAKDGELGISALSSHYKVGEVGCMWYDHKWSSRDPNMRKGTTDPTAPAQMVQLRHPATPDELYFRYYLKLGPGYQCSVDSKKLPGLAWRYGWWNYEGAGGGYYYPECGNGGNPSTGKYFPESPSRKTLCGGSMRGLAYAGPSDDNPVRDRIVLGYYAYHAEMLEYFGDFWRWGDAKVGYVNIDEGRWYCVEHRVKMNSIDLSAPDANGNGKGNRDGIVQGWLDGVLVFDKRDVVMRHHPAFKVDEVWLTHYHGGVEPAESEHPYAMAALVVAKDYIGPMRGVRLGGSGSSNYQGLWRDAGGVESGWGINLAHQGDVIFATWFTYDAKGAAWWLSMTANSNPDGSYSGLLYQTSGPAFNAVPFDPRDVTRTVVGSGTLAFASASSGAFTYAVNGITQTKAIVLAEFGPVPTCAWGAQPDLSVATNYQDVWSAAPVDSESGWGINLTQQGTTVFATWFTYNVDRSPMWYSVTAPQTAPNTFAGTLYRTTGPAFSEVPFNPDLVTRTAVGTATFTFSDGNTGRFDYQVNDGANLAVQSKAITRLVFRAPGTVCA